MHMCAVLDLIYDHLAWLDVILGRAAGFEECL